MSAIVVLRFAMSPLFGVLAGGIPLYVNVRKLGVLSMISQGPRFLQGLEIGGTVVCTVSRTARMGQGFSYKTY